MKENNYVRFDKQTSRENYQVDLSSKAHPGRFVYMAQSEFTRPGRKQYYIEFSKQKSRETKRFLGVDI